MEFFPFDQKRLIFLPTALMVREPRQNLSRQWPVNLKSLKTASLYSTLVDTYEPIIIADWFGFPI